MHNLSTTAVHAGAGLSPTPAHYVVDGGPIRADFYGTITNNSTEQWPFSWTETPTC